MDVHINPKFRIPREELEDNLQIKLQHNGSFEYIIPARDLAEINDISLVSNDKLERILRKVKLKDSDVHPYEHSDFGLHRISPSAINIGQSFVLEGKILDLCKFSQFARAFSLEGFSKLPPLLMKGKDGEGTKACAIYVPPIIELHEHYTLIDGIHRSYLTKSADTTMNYVIVRNVQVPLPFQPMNWDYAEQVSCRPDISNRYVNLRMDLFRDLSTVGIDG